MSGRPGFAYQTYEWQGRSEYMMRIGDPAGPAILFLAPLFEEMNRTRALITATMRGVAARGFCCWLPDLPGTGESLRGLDETQWEDWRGAVTTVAVDTGAIGTASLRGGCLLDDTAEVGRRWRMAPVTGASLLRDLARAGAVGGAKNAGYPIDKTISYALQNADPAEVGGIRVVRLATDAAPADTKLDGPALWRRSEPSGSPMLADAMAADIAGWFGA